MKRCGFPGFHHQTWQGFESINESGTDGDLALF
jgi:hypothetical protein